MRRATELYLQKQEQEARKKRQTYLVEIQQANLQQLAEEYSKASDAYFAAMLKKPGDEEDLKDKREKFYLAHFAIKHPRKIKKELEELRKNQLVKRQFNNPDAKSAANDSKFSQQIKLFGRATRDREQLSQHREKLAAIATSSVRVRNIFVIQQKNTKGEFSLEEKKLDDKNQEKVETRILNHIKAMTAIAREEHLKQNFYNPENFGIEDLNEQKSRETPKAPTLMIEDKTNEITRLSFPEFSFYPQKDEGPLDIETFNSLLKNIEQLAKQNPDNLHLMLGTFPVKDAKKIVHNVAVYAQCGAAAKLTLSVKALPSEIDSFYPETSAVYYNQTFHWRNIYEYVYNLGVHFCEQLATKADTLTPERVEEFRNAISQIPFYSPADELIDRLEQLEAILQDQPLSAQEGYKYAIEFQQLLGLIYFPSPELQTAVYEQNPSRKNVLLFFKLTEEEGWTKETLEVFQRIKNMEGDLDLVTDEDVKTFQDAREHIKTILGFSYRIFEQGQDHAQHSLDKLDEALDLKHEIKGIHAHFARHVETQTAGGAKLHVALETCLDHNKAVGKISLMQKLCQAVREPGFLLPETVSHVIVSNSTALTKGSAISDLVEHIDPYTVSDENEPSANKESQQKAKAPPNSPRANEEKAADIPQESESKQELEQEKQENKVEETQVNFDTIAAENEILEFEAQDHQQLFIKGTIPSRFAITSPHERTAETPSSRSESSPQGRMQQTPVNPMSPPPNQPEEPVKFIEKKIERRGGIHVIEKNAVKSIDAVTKKDVAQTAFGGPVHVDYYEPVQLRGFSEKYKGYVTSYNKMLYDIEVFRMLHSQYVKMAHTYDKETLQHLLNSLGTAIMRHILDSCLDAINKIHKEERHIQILNLAELLEKTIATIDNDKSPSSVQYSDIVDQLVKTINTTPFTELKFVTQLAKTLLVNEIKRQFALDQQQVFPPQFRR